MKIIARASMTAFIFLSVASQAAIPVQQAGTEKRNSYIKGGVVVGGRDLGPVTLINVRHSYDKEKGLERIVFDVLPKSSMTTETDAQRPGFFHIALQKKNGKARLVVQLENVDETKVSERQVTSILASKSRYFSGASFYPDEENNDLTIEMPMKSMAQVEVFELTSQSKPGRIVIDVKAP